MTILCIKNTQIINSIVRYYHMTLLELLTYYIHHSTYYRSKKFKNPVFCKLQHWSFFSIFRTALIAQIFVVCLQNRVGILFYSFTCISKINLRGLFITRQLMQQEYQGIIQITCNHTVFNWEYHVYNCNDFYSLTQILWKVNRIKTYSLNKVLQFYVQFDSFLPFW